MGNKKFYLRVKHRLGRLIDGAGPGPVARHDRGEHRGHVEALGELLGGIGEGGGDHEFCNTTRMSKCCCTIRQERVGFFVRLSNLDGTLM